VRHDQLARVARAVVGRDPEALADTMAEIGLIQDKFTNVRLTADRAW
jgi:hypothetical protein